VAVTTDHCDKLLGHDDFEQLYEQFLLHLVNLNHTKYTLHSSF